MNKRYEDYDNKFNLLKALLHEPGMTLERLTQSISVSVAQELHDRTCNTASFWFRIADQTNCMSPASIVFLEKQVYPWLIHTCGIPLDGGGGLPLLWDVCSNADIMWRARFAIALLDQGVPVSTNHNWSGHGELLRFMGHEDGWDLTKKDQKPHYQKLIRRLLDAGATISLRRADNEFYVELRTLYNGRIRCRAICYAILGLWKKKAPLARFIGRDVICLIARFVWETRWSPYWVNIN